jgi:hypothetical protein
MKNKELLNTLRNIAELNHSEQYAIFIALREIFDPTFMLKPWESVSPQVEAANTELKRRVEKVLELMNFDPQTSNRGGANFRQWLEIYGLDTESPKERPDAR